MRRSSSKRKSQRAGAGTPAVSELDDSALERHVGIVEDETPIEIASSSAPSSEVCENASLRYIIFLSLSICLRCRYNNNIEEKSFFPA